MFKKLLAEMIAAETEEQITNILYREDGVDRLYQKEKLSWNDHELLFDLAAKLEKAMRK